jgi:REP element-mobilizing transposase RayT
MARPHRLSIPGGTYHVMNRGNRKCPIFEDHHDRNRFLMILKEVSEEYEVEILAYSLMGNHFHAVVVTPRGNISAFMEQLQGRYAQYSNWRHHRVGHLFQGRFRAVVIDDDIHLLTELCYVFMNPVAAGLVSRMANWKWSTYAATVGLTKPSDYLSLDWLEMFFPEATHQQAQRLFRDLLEDARPVIAYLGQRKYASSDPVTQVVRSFIGQRLRGAAVPQRYVDALRPTLDELFREGMSRTERDAAIHAAHARYRYSLAEVAKQLNLHPETVGRAFRKRRLKQK